MLASAKSVYHNNFLEWKLTGDRKYKKVADDAMNSIEKVISNLQHQVDTMTTPPVSKKETERSFIKEKDALTEAEMRTKTVFLSVDWRYYALVGLAVIALVVKQ